MNDLIRIKATVSVEQQRYFNDARNFGIIVCSLNKLHEGTIQPDLDTERLVFKGTMPKPMIGAMYEVVADYTKDPKWGGQYQLVSMYMSIQFDENDDVGKKKFLCSLFTPGQVEAMYEALDDPFETLDKADAVNLIKVKGCALKTATRWITKFKKNLDNARIFTELAEYNLTNKMVEKLVDRYKSPDLVIDKVKGNPYILCTEVRGIGWTTADQIALDGGIGLYDTRRISAFIVHYLDKVGEDGYSWVTPNELLGAILQTLGEDVPDEVISESIKSLGDKLWIDDDKEKIGLRFYYDLEHHIAEELIRLRDAQSCCKFYGNWKDTVSRLEGLQGWKYTDEQLYGIEQALKHNVLLIQGEAGTGKTSLVSAMLQVLKRYSFVQTSLSGRAASRMSEVTHEEGYTIHRLLGYPKGTKQGFLYHDEFQLDVDIYIVDEVSMIDAKLMYYLLRAIPDGAKVIFLGDFAQLESIGAGNVAYDMLQSPEIPSVVLTKIHRQAEKSAIITESVKVRKGIQLVEKDWVGEETRGELQDLALHCYSDASNTFYNIMELFSSAMHQEDFDIMECQVIVPLRNRGDACTYNLNCAMQELYNPGADNKKEVIVFSHGKPFMIRIGDKVICTTNNYKTTPQVFNGNVGIVRKIGWMMPTKEEIEAMDDPNEAEEEESMLIDFKGIGTVRLGKNYWGTIELGYALSVHKEQGDQARYIIFGLDNTAYTLLTRELVYTGITRAQKKCDLVAQTGALRMAISKVGTSVKQTHLQKCLDDVAHPKIVF